MGQATKIISRRKVLVFANIIAPYNIPLFNKISVLLNGDILFLFDRLTEANRKWEVSSNKIQFEYIIGNAPYIKGRFSVANNASLPRTIYFPFYIFRKIWSYKPVIVVTSEFGMRTIFSLLAGKIIGAKIFVVSDVTMISEVNTSRSVQFFRRVIVKFLDGAIAKSYAAKKYLETIGFKNDQITVSPYAVEPVTSQVALSNEMKVTLETVERKIDGKYCFIFSGHFNHLKGLDLLNAAVNELPKFFKQKILFVMAGGNEQELRAALGKYDESIFLPIGFIPHDQMFFLYQIGDCFLLPTRSDTWALVVNEALMAGCPVMLSKYAGSAGELIENEITGVVFDPLDKDDFVKKMTFCIENKSRLNSFAVNAKGKLDEYNNDVSAKRFVTHIKLEAFV